MNIQENENTTWICMTNVKFAREERRRRFIIRLAGFMAASLILIISLPFAVNAILKLL